jgi:hypothetical protein
MPELNRTETKALRRDYLFMRYEEYKAIAAHHGMTETTLWTITFKTDQETTSNALAPLQRHVRPHLKGRPLLMLGMIVPAGGVITHKHGHGVLFLPEGLGDILETTTDVRNENVERSYQFQPPDPARGGEIGWINYATCARNGLRKGATFYISRSGEAS